MFLMQMTGHVPSSRAADTISFSVSEGDNFTYPKDVHKQGDTELPILSVIQAFESCTFLRNKIFPTV